MLLCLTVYVLYLPSTILMYQCVCHETFHNHHVVWPKDFNWPMSYKYRTWDKFRYVSLLSRHVYSNNNFGFGGCQPCTGLWPGKMSGGHCPTEFQYHTGISRIFTSLHLSVINGDARISLKLCLYFCFCFYCRVYKHQSLESRCNLTYRYIDDLLSINNPKFENYLGQMYPADLEIKDTAQSTTSASYLDLLLSIGKDGQLHTSIYDKRVYFNFHITNFPFLSSNIPSSPIYGVFISQRSARACSSCECFILRTGRLSRRLLKQEYL